MPDDKTQVGQDRRTIATGEDYELRDWAKALNTTPDKVKEAIRAVGNSADKVREYIRSKE